MRGSVSKMVRKKVMSELNRTELKGPMKAIAFKKGCRETKKQYNTINIPALPKVVYLNKKHTKESLIDFKERRRKSNARRREREFKRNNEGDAGLTRRDRKKQNGQSHV